RHGRRERDMRCLRRSRVLRHILLCLVTALLSAVPGMSAHAADDSHAPLRIGISLGLTGSYENITRQQQRAFRLWETHINERDGILGRKVQLIIRDDKSDPQVAKRIYEDFIEREKVHFVFAPYSSAVTSAVAPVTERHGY